MVDHVDILVVNAHPDDETICSGTLAKLTQKGHSLGLLDLTNGEPTNYGNPETRLKEAQKAAKILGASFRKTLDKPNRLLFDSIETRAYVAYWIRKLTPKCIIAMGQDPIHPDHIQLNNIVKRGIFYARLDQWEQYENPDLNKLSEFKPHMPDRLFFSVGRVNVNEQDISFIVDITDTMETKLDVYRCYKSQFGLAIEKDIEGWERRYRGRAAYWGQQIDREYGEPFQSRRMLNIEDPVNDIKPIRYG